MIVHDSETMEDAMALVGQGPVRYSDTFAYVIVTIPSSLEKLLTSALERDDVAIVVLKGMESTMEVHSNVLARVQKQRRVKELKDVRAYMGEHPELAKALGEALKTNPGLNTTKFLHDWRKMHD